MKFLRLFEGRLVRHLFLLFLALGLIPIILFTLIPAVYHTRASEQAAMEASTELEERTREDMLRFAELNAARYNDVLQEKVKAVNALAGYAGLILSEPGRYTGVMDWDVEADTYLLDGGWRVNGPDQPVSFLASPLATLDGESVKQQNGLAALTPFLQSVVEADPQIRSTFLILEEQILWLHPNRLWVEGEFRMPPATDVTQRPYYVRGTQEIVWSNPFTVADMEPAIMVAAPLWVDGQFMGMAGMSFSLQTIATEILRTEFGEQGFVFLITEQGSVFVLPRYTDTPILSSAYAGDPYATLNVPLLDVVSEEVRVQLEARNILANLQEKEPFVSRLDLPSGPTYFAFAPLADSPWYAVAVQPVEAVSGVARTMAENIDRAMSIARRLMLISGLGFLLVVLVGGVISLRSLALPVQQLITGADAVARGNLAYRVTLPSRDNEMRTLVQRFNGMVATVQETQNRLEQQAETLEQALAVRKREFEATNRLAALTNRQTSLPNKLKEALTITRDVLGLDITALDIHDEEGAFSFSSFVSEPEQREMMRRFLTICSQNGLMKQARETKQTIVVSSVTEYSGSIDPKLLSAYERLHVTSVIMEPITGKGRVLGVLSLLHSNTIEMTDRQFMFISTLAQHIAELIENAHLQNQTRALSIYNERQHLARELHDSVVQSLFTLNLTAEGLKSDLVDIPPAEVEALGLVVNQTRSIQKEMRTLINELRPVDLENESLTDALERHICSYRRTIEGKIELSIEGEINQIPHSIQRHLNRITQETLSNATRHAHASRVEVSLAANERRVCLTVKDNGCGFDPHSVMAEKSRSLGLQNMRERVEMMGGWLSIESASAEGTITIVEVPLTEEGKNDSG